MVVGGGAEVDLEVYGGGDGIMVVGGGLVAVETERERERERERECNEE